MCVINDDSPSPLLLAATWLEGIITSHKAESFLVLEAPLVKIRNVTLTIYQFKFIWNSLFFIKIS